MSGPAIRIGNQTSRHAKEIRLPYQLAIRQRFDAFEWFSDGGRSSWCEDEVSLEERAELLQTSREKNILFSVHAPFAADPMTDSGQDAILKSIRFGGDVGADVINVHLFPEHPAKLFADSLQPLLKAAQSVNVRISLENTPSTSPDHFNAVFGVLSAMPEARDRIGMCLDSGHANLFAETRNNFVRYVDLLGHHVPIIHWHAHENWGDNDSHLSLFTGPSAEDDRGLRALVQRLKERDFAGSVVLEQWPDPPEFLVQTRLRLQKLLSEEWATTG